VELEKLKLMVLAFLAEIKTAKNALLPTQMNAKNAMIISSLNKENAFLLAEKDFMLMLRKTVSPALKIVKSALTKNAYNAIITK
jgi:hypothetical protein